MISIKNLHLYVIIMCAQNLQSFLEAGQCNGQQYYKKGVKTRDMGS